MLSLIAMFTFLQTDVKPTDVSFIDKISDRLKVKSLIQ